MEEVKNQEQGKQTIIINQQSPRSNGIGVAGFVLALIALFLGWVPVWGWLLWLLGLIFSFCGILQTPRGLAVAGLIISLVDLIFLILLSLGILVVLSAL